METTLKKYAAKKNISMYRIAQVGEIPETTINSAFAKSLDKASVRVIRAFAVALNMTPGELLDDLIEMDK